MPPTLPTHAPRHSTSVTDQKNLLNLPFSVFACSVARLLVHLGYEDVSIKRPLHQRGKGRNSSGGFDIEAYLTNGLSRSCVIAQVKQYDRPVPRAFVDELRGTMLRHGAQQGILFSSSTFSAAAQEASRAAQSLPVRLVEGRELARLLRVTEVPIRADTDRSWETAPPPSSRRSKTPLPSPEGTPIPETFTAPEGTTGLAPHAVTLTLTLGFPAHPHDATI